MNHDSVLLPAVSVSFAHAGSEWSAAPYCMCLTLCALERSSTERRAVNTCFVIDSSGSMYYSMMSPRELSRWAQIARSRGELATVVSDGKTMQTVVGQTKREMKEADITPMQFVVKAIRTSLEKLGPDDEVGVIAFADKGRLLGEGTARAFPTECLQELADRGYSRELGTGTHLANGLGLCLDWLSERRYSDARKKVFLFSDGRLDDQQRAMLSLKRVMQTGASISTFGLGIEFDEDMMSQIADNAGGDYHYMEHPNQVAQALEQEMIVQRSLVTGDIHVNIRPGEGVTLGALYQALPFVKAVEPLRRTLVDQTFNAGALAGGEERVFLVELHLSPPEGEAYVAEIEIGPEPDGSGRRGRSMTVDARLAPGGAEPASSDGPVTQLARRVGAFALQRDARVAAETGRHDAAAQTMDRLSNLLEGLGQSDLAGAAREEAEVMRGEKAADQGRTKRLKAATRKITRS